MVWVNAMVKYFSLQCKNFLDSAQATPIQQEEAVILFGHPALVTHNQWNFTLKSSPFGKPRGKKDICFVTMWWISGLQERWVELFQGEPILHPPGELYEGALFHTPCRLVFPFLTTTKQNKTKMYPCYHSVYKLISWKMGSNLGSVA